MKKIINKILNIYCIILITILVVVGLQSIKKPIDIILPFLLLPVFFYLTGGLIRQFKKINWLFWIYSILFSIVILIADVINVRKISDLIFVTFVLPLPIYLIINFKQKIKSFFKEKKDSVKQNEKDEQAVIAELIDDKEEERKEIDDTKRKFLKLLAGTGITTVLLYIFKTKKAEAAFFGNGSGPSVMSIKDSQGNTIDPAVSSPTEGYGICNIAAGTSVKTDNYYGYVDKNGSWYILQEDTVNNTYSYASIMNNNSVITGYAAAWSGRESLTYGNFNDAF